MKVELSKKKKKKLEEQYYQLHKLRIAVSLEQVRRRKIWKKKKGNLLEVISLLGALE